MDEQRDAFRSGGIQTSSVDVGLYWVVEFLAVLGIHHEEAGGETSDRGGAE